MPKTFLAMIFILHFYGLRSRRFTGKRWDPVYRRRTFRYAGRIFTSKIMKQRGHLNIVIFTASCSPVWTMFVDLVSRLQSIQETVLLCMQRDITKCLYGKSSQLCPPADFSSTLENREPSGWRCNSETVFYFIFDLSFLFLTKIIAENILEYWRHCSLKIRAFVC